MTKMTVEELERVRFRRQKRKTKSKRRKTIRIIKTARKPDTLATKSTKRRNTKRVETSVEVPNVKDLQWTMLGIEGVDEQLVKSLGVTVTQLEPILRNGGDAGETKFMECCWLLWKTNGTDLIEPFIEAAFNLLPDKSRSVLFVRMMTIVYVAQNAEAKRTIT